jgi:hypothetical protein
MLKNARSQSLRWMAALVATFALSMIFSSNAFAQSKLDFTLHNATGLVITEVYISETGNEDWEEDVLGRDTLDDGDSVDIKFGGQAANNWDIKVVFSNGRSNYWRKINLSQLTDLTISFKNGKPWATWKNGG